MRDPRIDPIVGDMVERNGVVRAVTELWYVDRLGLSGTSHVCFRHHKRGREEEEATGALSLAKWRERTEGAKILKRGDDPVIVTQEARDALKDAIWEVIKGRTKHWVDREQEIYDALSELASAMLDMAEVLFAERDVMESQELEGD